MVTRKKQLPTVYGLCLQKSEPVIGQGRAIILLPCPEVLHLLTLRKSLQEFVEHVGNVNRCAHACSQVLASVVRSNTSGHTEKLFLFIFEPNFID